MIQCVFLCKVLHGRIPTAKLSGLFWFGDNFKKGAGAKQGISSPSVLFSELDVTSAVAELELSRYQHHQTSERRDVLDEGLPAAVDSTKCSKAKQIHYDQL